MDAKFKIIRKLRHWMIRIFNDIILINGFQKVFYLKNLI